MNRMVGVLLLCRHSGASRSDEPGISRFRVRLFEPPRNDDKSSLLRGRPQPLFLLAQLGGEGFAEIFRGKHLADFDLVAARERGALHPFNRFIERFGVYQPETAYEIAGERERPAADA